MDRKFVIIIKPEAIQDIAAHKKSGNKSVLKKIEIILEELRTQPFSGVGRPEQLKHDLSGYWSRRVNQKHRMIYKVELNIVTVTVVSAMGHYYDK